MDLYDPEYPALNYGFNCITLNPNVGYNLSIFLKYGDLILVLDEKIIGNIHQMCSRIFVHSKLKNGILKIQTDCDEDIGYLVIVNRTAHHFIPTSCTGFPIDETILYKKDQKNNKHIVNG